MAEKTENVRMRVDSAAYKNALAGAAAATRELGDRLRSVAPEPGIAYRVTWQHRLEGVVPQGVTAVTADVRSARPGGAGGSSFRYGTSVFYVERTFERCYALVRYDPYEITLVDAVTGQQARVQPDAWRRAKILRVWPHCHAGSDGDCYWERCPQQTAARYRHCVLDLHDLTPEEPFDAHKPTALCTGGHSALHCPEPRRPYNHAEHLALTGHNHPPGPCPVPVHPGHRPVA